jgi:hypothetical protein
MSRRSFCRSVSASLLLSFTATAAHAANYTRSYLVNDFLLPTTASETNSYAIDVDGDGRPDNNLGQLFTALTTQGFDISGSMQAATASGSIVHLVGLRSTDALFKNDPAAQATWCIGVPTATPPVFDGTDNVSCADTSGFFVAALSGGNFTSPSPFSAPNPVSVDVALDTGISNVQLTVLNARLSFTINTAGDISVGQINGSIRHDDLVNIFLPGVDATCNTSIQSDPSSELSTGCKNVFDTGCSGHPEYSADGQIELCEVTENAIINALLHPDVQVADGGTFVGANSIGFRFTAIANDRVFANGFDL